MPKYSHAELARWYQKFAKEVYEKVNIDVNRIEDIGRIKMFYFTKQDVNEPLGPEGEFQYAYIPHERAKRNDCHAWLQCRPANISLRRRLNIRQAERESFH